jgi:dihydrofolate reductase
MPIVSLVVAAAQNRVIGRGGSLPWRLPEDLRRFKAITMGKPILMGRKTWESIGRPLPGRDNLVLTRDGAAGAAAAARGAIVVHSLEEAFGRCARAPEIAVIGGAEIYRLALPRATRIHLTRVLADVDGDTFLPELAPEQWRVTQREYWPSDERNEHAMSFETLERTAPAPAA